MCTAISTCRFNIGHLLLRVDDFGKESILGSIGKVKYMLTDTGYIPRQENMWYLSHNNEIDLGKLDTTHHRLWLVFVLVRGKNIFKATH